MVFFDNMLIQSSLGSVSEATAANWANKRQRYWPKLYTSHSFLSLLRERLIRPDPTVNSIWRIAEGQNTGSRREVPWVSLIWATYCGIAHVIVTCWSRVSLIVVVRIDMIVPLPNMVWVIVCHCPLRDLEDFMLRV